MAFGPLFPTAILFSWVGIGFIEATDFKKPNPTKFSANTGLMHIKLGWFAPQDSGAGNVVWGQASPRARDPTRGLIYVHLQNSLFGVSHGTGKPRNVTINLNRHCSVDSESFITLRGGL